jgi:hypothetical protein
VQGTRPGAACTDNHEGAKNGEDREEIEGPRSVFRFFFAIFDLFMCCVVTMPRMIRSVGGLLTAAGVLCRRFPNDTRFSGNLSSRAAGP